MKIILFLITVMTIMLSGCKKALLVKEERTVDTESFHNRGMGASSRELLDDRDYKSLIVEIQYMPGFKPDPKTLDYLRKFLQTYLNKPKGIKIVLMEIDGVENDTLSKDEVLAVEKANRTRFVADDTTAIYLLFTNGIHPGRKILGMAYRNTSAVIYGKAIDKHFTKSGKLTRAELETAVLLHEVGHLMGLVNKGSMPESQHSDPVHQDHCNNKKCLMYFSVETMNLSTILLKGNIPVFDENCIADLIANGGKNTPDFKPFIRPF
jgi:predicted Zn-dependent protease